VVQGLRMAMMQPSNGRDEEGTGKADAVGEHDRKEAAMA
jgi:hypothetical protein